MVNIIYINNYEEASEELHKVVEHKKKVIDNNLDPNPTRMDDVYEKVQENKNKYSGVYPTQNDVGNYLASLITNSI